MARFVALRLSWPLQLDKRQPFGKGASLVLFIIRDPGEMSALRPRFLPNDVPVRRPSLTEPQSSPLADLLVRVDAHGRMLYSYARFSLGR